MNRIAYISNTTKERFRERAADVFCGRKRNRNLVLGGEQGKGYICCLIMMSFLFFFFTFHLILSCLRWFSLFLSLSLSLSTSHSEKKNHSLTCLSVVELYMIFCSTKSNGKTQRSMSTHTLSPFTLLPSIPIEMLDDRYDYTTSMQWMSAGDG